MRILVINITWQNATKTLPTRVSVEVEDDTAADDLPEQVKYALWRATGTMPITYEIKKGGAK